VFVVVVVDVVVLVVVVAVVVDVAASAMQVINLQISKSRFPSLSNIGLTPCST
jgi:hypothetical protein